LTTEPATDRAGTLGDAVAEEGRKRSEMEQKSLKMPENYVKIIFGRLGKDEIGSSNLPSSSNIKHLNLRI